MREVTYYRWAATLPVVLPFIAHLFYRDDPTIGLIDRVTTLLYVSGVAWPAYVPFAAALFWWLAGEPAARYRRRSWGPPRPCPLPLSVSPPPLPGSAARTRSAASVAPFCSTRLVLVWS